MIKSPAVRFQPGDAALSRLREYGVWENGVIDPGALSNNQRNLDT